MQRTRSTICLAICGAALGLAFVAIGVSSRGQSLPEFLKLAPLASTVFAAGGVLPAAFASAALGCFATPAGSSRGLLSWAAICLVYGLLLPFVVGAAAPMSSTFADAAVGRMPASTLPWVAAQALFVAPLSAFTSGFLGLYTGFIAGAALTPFAWLIDRLNRPRTSRYAGLWAMSAALLFATMIVAVAWFAPPDLLQRFA